MFNFQLHAKRTTRRIILHTTRTLELSASTQASSLVSYNGYVLKAMRQIQANREKSQRSSTCFRRLKADWENSWLVISRSQTGWQKDPSKSLYSKNYWTHGPGLICSTCRPNHIYCNRKLSSFAWKQFGITCRWISVESIIGGWGGCSTRESSSFVRARLRGVLLHNVFGSRKSWLGFAIAFSPIELSLLPFGSDKFTVFLSLVPAKRLNLLATFCLAKRISQATEVTPDVHMFLMHAILLRIQSGSDCRHCDLARIEWAHVEKHEYVVGLEECTFSVKITPSKITFTQDATPLEYFASDDITATLFTHWHNLHSTSGRWFFPRVLKGDTFDFSLQMKPETHTQACQMCAEVLGLQVSTQFKRGLGANAVRRGNAATVGIAIKGVDENCNSFFSFVVPWE